MFQDVLLEAFRVIARSPQRSEALFARHSAAVQQLQNGESFYRILVDPSSAVRGTLVQLIGQAEFDRIQTHIRRYTPSAEQLRALREVYENPTRMFGTYADLRANIDRSISRLLEADHIIEQRIHRMLMDGPRGHTARSWGESVTGDAQRAVERRWGATALADNLAIDDGFAVLVPAEDVTAHGIMHGLGRGGNASRAPLFYIHQGLASKTSRMETFLPYRLEGEFTYQEILDAHRWVVLREFGLPPQLDEVIREDMVDSIVYAIRHDSLAAEVLLPTLPGRRVSATSDRLPQSVRNMLQLRPLPANFPSTFRSLVPILDRLQALGEVRGEVRRLVEGAQHARAGRSRQPGRRSTPSRGRSR